MEEWKDIVGFEGLYQVSNMGRVRSFDQYIDGSHGCKRLVKGKILKPCKSGRKANPYYEVFLYKEKKRYRVPLHRLVAKAFIDNTENYPCVNHKDEDPSNNKADNLEWCTHKYNNSYGNRLKIIGDKHKKKVYCVTLNEQYDSIKEASIKTGIERSLIGSVCNHRAHTAKGMVFRFAE